MPRIPHPFGIVARSLTLRFLLVLGLLLVFIINTISFSSRDNAGLYPMTRLKSPALVYLPSVGADFCACYSPPSSSLDDIALISSGINLPPAPHV
jgi:hypothetical protein